MRRGRRELRARAQVGVKEQRKLACLRARGRGRRDSQPGMPGVQHEPGTPRPQDGVTGARGSPRKTVLPDAVGPICVPAVPSAAVALTWKMAVFVE